MTKVQKKILSVLLDKYENSKSYTNENSDGIHIFDVDTEKGTFTHRDEVTVAPVLLEAALAIAVFTLSVAEYVQATSRYLDHTDVQDMVFGLDPVGSDILDGTGSHVAGNEREVLQPVVACLNAGSNNVVEAGTTATAHPVAILEGHTLQGRVYYDAVEISGQQQVAATTYNNIGHVRLAQHPRYLLCFLNGLVFQETTTLGINTKCVML